MAKSEESLNEQEEKTGQELGAADELLKDTSKLDSALASVPLNINSITATKMKLETVNNKRKDTMEPLDEIRRKQKSLDQTTQTIRSSTTLQRLISKEKKK